MAVWLNPRGKSTFGIGICDRCSRKMSLDDLYSDPNFPGLRVCLKDLDVFDPWRLPARVTEDIHLRFTRPDIPISTNPYGILSEASLGSPEGDYFLVGQVEVPAPTPTNPNATTLVEGWLVP